MTISCFRVFLKYNIKWCLIRIKIFYCYSTISKWKNIDNFTDQNKEMTISHWNIIYCKLRIKEQSMQMTDESHVTTSVGLDLTVILAYIKLLKPWNGFGQKLLIVMEVYVIVLAKNQSIWLNLTLELRILAGDISSSYLWRSR